MVITLIGYRGSGKTSVARVLAGRLGWDWLDADEELERREGRSIREIFAADGEAYFREAERDLLAELLAWDRLVLAAGGGAVLNADTRTDMKNAGPVVWLRASADVLESRITGDETTEQRRPDLTASGGRGEIETLLRERTPLYEECASLTVDTDRLDVDAVAERILTALGPRVQEGEPGP